MICLLWLCAVPPVYGRVPTCVARYAGRRPRAAACCAAGAVVYLVIAEWNCLLIGHVAKIAVRTEIMLAALFLSGCAAFHGHAIGSSARGAVRASAVEQPVSSSRRAATGLLLQAGALSLLGAAPRPASAGFFESQEQEQVRAVATAQPKITSMVSEVAE
eukprot:258930-Prymnesium_polylepis.1